MSVGGESREITIDKDNVVTEGVKISIPAGVKPSDKMTFTFRDRYCTGVETWFGRLQGFNFSTSTNPATYSYECTVEEFLNGVTLDFKRPQQ